MLLSPIMQRSTVAAIIFIIIATLLLFTAIERARHSQRFANFATSLERENEELVVDRLRANRANGITSYGFLAGTFCPRNSVSTSQSYLLYETQPCATEERSQRPGYQPYRLHHGFQLLAMSIFNSRQGRRDIAVLSGVVGTLHRLFFAAIFALYIGWLYIELSRTGAIIALFSLIFAVPILTAGNNFLPLYALFIPLVASAWLFYLFRRRSVSHSRLWIGYGALLLYSQLIAGYTFLLVSLLAAFLPIVYYALVDRWSWKKFTNMLLSIKLTMIVVLFIGFVLLILQNISADGTVRGFIAELGTALSGASYGSPFRHDPLIANSLLVEYNTVSAMLLDGTLFSLQMQVNNVNADISLTMRTLVSICLIVGLCIAIFHAFAGHTVRFPRRFYALLNYKLLSYSVAALFSLLPPLLYVIVAKSFVLRALPSVLFLWLLPTAPFIISYYGYVTQRLLLMIFGQRK